MPASRDRDYRRDYRDSNYHHRPYHREQARSTTSATAEPVPRVEPKLEDQNEKCCDPILRQRGGDIFADLYHLAFVVIELAHHLTVYNLPTLDTIKNFPKPLQSHIFYLYYIIDLGISVLSKTRTLPPVFVKPDHPFSKKYTATIERPSPSYIAANFNPEWFSLIEPLRQLYKPFEHCERVSALFHTLRCPVHVSQFVHGLTHSFSSDNTQTLFNRLNNPNTFSAFRNSVFNYAELKQYSPMLDNTILPLLKTAFFAQARAPTADAIATYCKNFINIYNANKERHTFGNCKNCSAGDCTYITQTFTACQFQSDSAKYWYEKGADMCSCKTATDTDFDWEKKYLQTKEQCVIITNDVNNINKELIRAKEEINRLQKQARADKLQIDGLLQSNQQLSKQMHQATSSYINCAPQHPAMDNRHWNPTLNELLPGDYTNPMSVQTVCQDENMMPPPPLTKKPDQTMLTTSSSYMTGSNSTNTASNTYLQENLHLNQTNNYYNNPTATQNPKPSNNGTYQGSNSVTCQNSGGNSFYAHTTNGNNTKTELVSPPTSGNSDDVPWINGDL